MIRPISIILTLLITGCAGGSLKPTVPAGEDARKACPVTEGLVIQVTDVRIERAPEVAQATGAAVGGYVGNRALKDAGEVAQVLGTVAGAAVGSVAGDMTGKAVLNRDGQELIVVINGETRSIVQETDSAQPFRVGDTVYVIGDLYNRSGRYGRNNLAIECADGLRAIIKTGK